MTIELVAMLFDFIFETKDLPDGIKALLARLQIPGAQGGDARRRVLREEESSVAPARERARRGRARAGRR